MHAPLVHRGALPAWIECPTCPGTYCTIHELHIADCPCPEVYAWNAVGLDPYLDHGPKVLRWLRKVARDRAH